MDERRKNPPTPPPILNYAPASFASQPCGNHPINPGVCVRESLCCGPQTAADKPAGRPRKRVCGSTYLRRRRRRKPHANRTAGWRARHATISHASEAGGKSTPLPQFPCAKCVKLRGGGEPTAQQRKKGS